MHKSKLKPFLTKHSFKNLHQNLMLDTVTAGFVKEAFTNRNEQ